MEDIFKLGSSASEFCEWIQVGYKHIYMYIYIYVLHHMFYVLHLFLILVFSCFC